MPDIRRNSLTASNPTETFRTRVSLLNRYIERTETEAEGRKENAHFGQMSRWSVEVRERCYKSSAEENIKRNEKVFYQTSPITRRILQYSRIRLYESRIIIRF